MSDEEPIADAGVIEGESSDDAAVQPLQFGPLGGDVSPQSAGGLDEGGAPGGNLDILLDVQIPVTVEVGASKMPLEKILELVPGSIVCLDKKAEDPIDLRVNGKLVARGEVVLVDDTYGLRITQIVDTLGRLESVQAAE